MFTYFTAILLALALMILFILASTRQYVLGTQSAGLLKEANMAATFAAEEMKAGATADMFAGEEYKKYARILLIDKDSRVVFDTNETAGLRGKIFSAPWILRALGGENASSEITENGIHYMRVAVPVYEGKNIIGALIFKNSVDEEYALFEHIRHNLIWIAVCGSLFIGLFGLFLSAIFTAPLSRLTGQIKEMSETDAKKLDHIRGGKEITDLVTAFNLMVDQIDDIDNRRQEFVSNAAHELKTPLSSIKLICDSLLQNPETDRATVNEFLEDMNGQVDRLTRIINKLLSLTKLDASTDEAEIFAFATVNLQVLIENVIRALQPLAEKKNIQIEKHLPDSVFLRVDADKMWEAIYNILDNSIKYTGEDGKVYVELYRDEENAYITVADNGIGMADSEFNKIFDRFYRVDKARARETGGTGLGLSIALGAVEIHGGYIEVESREGEGSLFRIILPISTEL